MAHSHSQSQKRVTAVDRSSVAVGGQMVGIQAGVGNACMGGGRRRQDTKEDTPSAAVKATARCFIEDCEHQPPSKRFKHRRSGPPPPPAESGRGQTRGSARQSCSRGRAGGEAGVDSLAAWRGGQGQQPSHEPSHSCLHAAHVSGQPLPPTPAPQRLAAQLAPAVQLLRAIPTLIPSPEP